MKIIAINGSPREDGNTFQYLNMVLEEAKKLGAETELVQLAGKEIKGCRGCYQCVQAKKCTQVDDFQSIFPRRRADAILLGSPVCHSLSPELKAVLDGQAFRPLGQERNEAGRLPVGNHGLIRVVVPVTAARRAGITSPLPKSCCGRPPTIVNGQHLLECRRCRQAEKDASDDAEGVGIMQNLARRVVALERL